MATQLPKEFPVKVSKGTGDDKVTRHAHSPIAFRQLETQGFKVEGGGKKAQPAQQGQSQAAKPADKSAENK